MFTLITLPLAKFGDIATWSIVSEGGFLDLFTLLVPFGTGLFYWINCFKLRKINAQRKLKIKQKAVVSAEA